MLIEKIISLANKKSELRFLAMVRSLRNTGCNLPVWVIPYDDDKFNLPEYCVWWEIKEITRWLDASGAHKMMRKYQCLVTSNYQFVDADVIFIKNPQNTLANVNGFITSCGHWHNPEQTYTNSSLKYFNEESTTWQKKIFNAGQFACDRILYSINSLKDTAENNLYKEACIDFKFHDQPGLNLLVHLAKISVTNLTLPPHNMESTWAGDYPANYIKFWIDEASKPYLIHWAGCKMDNNRPIDELFLKLLTPTEKRIWEDRLLKDGIKHNKLHHKFFRILRHLKLVVQSLDFRSL